MAFCVNCGRELTDGANFCTNCGTAVVQNLSSNRKTVYEGELHKCPNCGEVLGAFVVTCPACNYDLRGVKPSSVLKEFCDKLEQIEKMRAVSKPRSFISKLYGSDGQLNRTDEQKINLIRSFSIPNSKEDIFEFIFLAATNIDLKLYGLGNMGVITASQRAVSDAWLAKFEQAYEKALFSFASSPDFPHIKRLYVKKTKQLKHKRLELPLLILGIFCVALFPWILIGIFDLI